eukprot:TRINITY_DN25401_c0_g1_i1.p1 TRINITY_DN25401_c0_g1~~TRINITY_DN25401_c0_g1_i1.p1  ORF type:complete len:300 (+),score=17.34 TRINITY_DN25401_c0_g1_i1:64-963(+)
MCIRDRNRSPLNLREGSNNSLQVNMNVQPAKRTAFGESLVKEISISKSKFMIQDLHGLLSPYVSSVRLRSELVVPYESFTTKEPERVKRKSTKVSKVSVIFSRGKIYHRLEAPVQRKKLGLSLVHLVQLMIQRGQNILHINANSILDDKSSSFRVDVLQNHTKWSIFNQGKTLTTIEKSLLDLALGVHVIKGQGFSKALSIHNAVEDLLDIFPEVYSTPGICPPVRCKGPHNERSLRKLCLQKLNISPNICSKLLFRVNLQLVDNLLKTKDLSNLFLKFPTQEFTFKGSSLGLINYHLY